MSRRHWEGILEDLGEHAWDAATELVSMVYDEHLPTLINESDAREMVARIVRDLLLDADYRVLVEELLGYTMDRFDPTKLSEPRSTRSSRYDALEIDGGADTSDGSSGRGTAAPPSPGDDRG